MDSSACAPPAEAEPSNAASCDEIHIFATILADNALPVIGEISGPRQEAVNISPEASREGSQAQHPYIPSVQQKLHGPPRETQGPAHEGAAEAEIG